MVDVIGYIFMIVLSALIAAFIIASLKNRFPKSWPGKVLWALLGIGVCVASTLLFNKAPAMIASERAESIANQVANDRDNLAREAIRQRMLAYGLSYEQLVVAGDGQSATMKAWLLKGNKGELKHTLSAVFYDNQWHIGCPFPESSGAPHGMRELKGDFLKQYNDTAGCPAIDPDAPATSVAPS